ncbi:MAG: hypothetical protein K0S76_3262, partial [Herbinix sp.]|nr:hypothetical protein [Herbinix sp.]
MDNTNDNLLDLMPITKNQDFLHFLYCSDIAVIYLDKHGCIQFLTPIVTTITGIMMDEIGKNISDTLLIQKYPLLQKRVDELISLINDYL